METEKIEKTEKKDILNSKSLKVFIKSSFVIIGLFVVLSYGVVTLLVLRFCDNPECKVNLLILIFAIIPLIVLFGFFCFVNKMSYWFKGNKNDETINIKNINKFFNIFKILKSCFVKKDEELKKKLHNNFFEFFDGYIKKLFSKGKEND